MEEDVLYGNVNRGARFDNTYRQARRGGNIQRRFPPHQNTYSPNTGISGNASFKKKAYGAPGEKRKLRCNICESTMHLSYGCPHKRAYVAEEGAEPEDDYTVVLYQSKLITDEEYKAFVVESSTSAILDSGASGNVAGLTWFNSYVSGLSDAEQNRVKYFDSASTFRFGSGKSFKSLFKAEIPAYIGKERILISTDIVDTSVPLLFSKQAMKEAGTKINFITDEVTMFGSVQQVQVTDAGHYAIPLNRSGEIIKQIESGNEVKVTLVAQSNINKRQMAKKLHAQFGHPVTKKLVKVVKRAGMGGDKELIKAINDETDECQVCKEFTKPSPTPIVVMPHAETFNETVAIDLKFYKGKIILHLIDHLT